MKKWFIVALLLILAGGFYICTRLPVLGIVTINQIVKNPGNRHKIDSAVSIVQDGDIVVRTGNDMTSYMFCRANLTHKTYSHCGVVAIENGYPFVYHAIGGEDNPNEALRKDSLQFWLSPAHNTGFGIRRFALSPAQKDMLLAVVRRYYYLRTKFDLKFDLHDDSRLYCGELVYRALNKAMNDTALIKPTRSMGYTYIAIDNITCTPHAAWVWQVRYK